MVVVGPSFRYLFGFKKKMSNYSCSSSFSVSALFCNQVTGMGFVVFCIKVRVKGCNLVYLEGIGI